MIRLMQRDNKVSDTAAKNRKIKRFSFLINALGIPDGWVTLFVRE